MYFLTAPEQVVCVWLTHRSSCLRMDEGVLSLGTCLDPFFFAGGSYNMQLSCWVPEHLHLTFFCYFSGLDQGFSGA
jgi:hypothetical protein